MPRFLVERSFPGGLAISIDDAGAGMWRGVIDANARLGVTWVHSYVTADRKKTFCVYVGPDAETVREAAVRSALPVDRISEVTVLDPYLYEGGEET